MSKTYQAELVVVGGGLAGFSAALAAAEKGVSVLLLEKTAEIGGSSAMSGGCLAFAGTDLQQQNGIEDSSEKLFEDLVTVGKGEADEALVKAYTDLQLDTYEWLKTNGVEFQPVIETASGQSVPRVHNVDPADMVRQLAKAAGQTGKVDILFSTRALRLTRAAGGRVTGLTASSKGEDVEILASKGVVLACGGFVKDQEMIHRFAPLYGISRRSR